MTTEKQAAVCHIVLSRAYHELSQQGKIVPLDDRTWGYRDESHIIGYDPQSDCLWISNRDGSSRMEWREGAWINPTATLSPEFLRDIKDLDNRLDAMGTPTQVSLNEAQFQAETHAEFALFNEPSTQSLQSAARLFEQYAETGKTAYQVDGSTAHHYRVEIGSQTYIISRDDNTDRYRLTREDDLWTDADESAWQNVGQWVTAQSQQDEKMRSEETVPYWEQQQNWAQQMLPVALHLAQESPENNAIQTFQWKDFSLTFHPEQETLEVSCRNVPLFEAERCSSDPQISLSGHLTADRWREFLPLLTWNQIAGGQQSLQQEWSRVVSASVDCSEQSNEMERD